MDTLADIGTTESSMRLVFSTIVSIILLAVGIYMFLYNDLYYKYTTATVTKPSYIDKNKIYTPITYTVDGKEYTKNIPDSVSRTTGSQFQVAYSKSDPNDVVMHLASKNTAGFILIGIAILLFIMAYASNKIIHKSKTFAAAEGIGDVAGIARNIL